MEWVILLYLATSPQNVPPNASPQNKIPPKSQNHRDLKSFSYYNSDKAMRGFALLSCAVLAAFVSCDSEGGIVRAVDVGLTHTCASLSDGAVKCWGANGAGQLGNGESGYIWRGVPRFPNETHALSIATSPYAVPITSVVPVKVVGLTGITTVSLGDHHSCALMSDRTVRCWGSGGSGELGDGSTQDHSIPVRAAGLTKVKSISCGGNTTCALRSDGKVSCWGNNSDGQIGDGSTEHRAVPTEIENLSGIVSIAVGCRHSCALVSDGTVRCWGLNNRGELGIGHNDGPESCSNIWDCSTRPQTVKGLRNVKQLSVGCRFACAALTDGTARCWGDSFFGGLGNGTVHGYEVEPVAVQSLKNVLSVAAGGSHACAVTKGGGVKCWGSTFRGTLGNGEHWQDIASDCGRDPCVTAPVQVKGISDGVAITAAHYHSCILRASGRISCWGGNQYGQLGDGTTEDRFSPVEVDVQSGAIDDGINEGG